MNQTKSDGTEKESRCMSLVDLAHAYNYKNIFLKALHHFKHKLYTRNVFSIKKDINLCYILVFLADALS